MKLNEDIEIPYTLIVTMEAPGSDLPIYEQVRAKVDKKVKEKIRQERVS